jgi:hypothetical protein
MVRSLHVKMYIARVRTIWEDQHPFSTQLAIRSVPPSLHFEPVAVVIANEAIIYTSLMTHFSKKPKTTLGLGSYVGP